MSLIGLGVLILLPSSAIAQKYSGIFGAFGYITCASTIFFLGHKFAVLRQFSTISNQLADRLLIITLLIIFIAFLIIFPIANSGIVGGGSDRDEALNIAVSELIEGRYPYYPKTYLDNPISPLPGLLFLSTPFVFLGNVAYQNIFYLGLLLIWIRKKVFNGGNTLLFLWSLFIFCPLVFYEIFRGSDLLANSIIILVFSLGLIHLLREPANKRVIKIFLAVLLGLSISSRLNFILLLPLIFSAFVNANDWKAAVKYMALTISTTLLVTVPFYLYDPSGFSPLHTIGFLDQFETLISNAPFYIILANAILSILLSIQNNSDTFTYLINCAIILAIPVICGTILGSIIGGGSDLAFALFGASYIIFCALAFWIKVIGFDYSYKH